MEISPPNGLAINPTPNSLGLGQGECPESLIDKLHSFDSMQWSLLPKKQHHSLSASSLSKEAIKRLNVIKRVRVEPFKDDALPKHP